MGLALPIRYGRETGLDSPGRCRILCSPIQPPLQQVCCNLAGRVVTPAKPRGKPGPPASAKPPRAAIIERVSLQPGQTSPHSQHICACGIRIHAGQSQRRVMVLRPDGRRHRRGGGNAGRRLCAMEVLVFYRRMSMASSRCDYIDITSQCLVLVGCPLQPHLGNFIRAEIQPTPHRSPASPEESTPEQTLDATLLVDEPGHLHPAHVLPPGC